jgi:hypothetical protein
MFLKVLVILRRNRTGFENKKLASAEVPKNLSARRIGAFRYH